MIELAEKSSKYKAAIVVSAHFKLRSVPLPVFYKYTTEQKTELRI